MAKFCKIFESDENYQVLVRVEFNPDTDKYDVIVSTEIENINAQMKHEFESDTEAYQSLNHYTQEQAAAFLFVCKRTLIGN